MASVRDRAYDTFDRDGPDAHTAAEWAEELDTSKAYVYQLRGDYREEHGETDSTDGESGEEPEPTDAPDDTPEPAASQSGHDGRKSGSDPEGQVPPGDTQEPTSAPTPTPDGGDMVAVGHEGKDKLSPAGFEDEAVSSIDAPDGVDLPADTSPADFEATDGPQPEPEPEPTPEPEPEEKDDSGGLLSRIRGDRSATESPSTEEVVEEAPDSAESERREDVLGALENATAGGTQDTESGDEGPETSQMSNGLVVDEDLMSTLFGLPFAQAANATGWDGWELSDEEKAVNAELLIAYCDEQDVDLSAGGMLAMSLLSTVGGRAAGYARHRRSQSEESAEHQERGNREKSDDHDPEKSGQSESTTSERETPSGEDSTTTEATTGDGEAFDFTDSSTW